MSIVNCCIVGMPKAGTTSLHQYLAQHPEIFMSPDKEPHFFSTDLLKEGEELHGYAKYTRYPSLERYHQLFSERGEATIVGESSVFYLFSKNAAEEIYKYNPNTKIIIMLRELVTFLYSLHSQGLFSGNETEKSFEKALELQERRMEGKELPPTVHFPSRLYYDQHIEIAQQISRYLKLFPREQIKIILFDDFKNDTKKTYKEVLQFLGISEDFTPSLIDHNPNTKMRYQFLARMLQDPKHPVTFTVKKVFPRKIWKKGKAVGLKLNTRVTEREPISPRTKRHLREKARPKVKELEQLLKEKRFLEADRDLFAIWGY